MLRCMVPRSSVRQAHSATYIMIRTIVRCVFGISASMLITALLSIEIR